MPAGTSWPPIELGGLTHVSWSVVASQIPGILGVTLITLICIVLNAGALELGSGTELDMNREFQAEGAANLVAALGASHPGCNSSPMTLISHATGAETRLTGIVVALAVGSVLFFGGDLLAFLPDAVARRPGALRWARPSDRLADRDLEDTAAIRLRHDSFGCSRHWLLRFRRRR